MGAGGHIEFEQNYGIGNRMLDDRRTEQPVGGEIEAGYGIGNRMLDDRHAEEPVGGEIEAGYGIGNRNLAVTHRKACDQSQVHQQKSTFQFGSDDAGPSISDAQYDASLALRLKQRPF